MLDEKTIIGERARVIEKPIDNERATNSEETIDGERGERSKASPPLFMPTATGKGDSLL